VDAEEVAVDTLLDSRWWTFAVRALVAALLGVAVLTRQDLSTHEFSRWFGVYAMVNGLLALRATVRSFDAGNPWGDPGWDGTPTYTIDLAWRAVAAEGVLSFVVGFVALVAPIRSDRVLFGVIAGAAFAIAVAQALAARALRDLATGGWAMALAATVSVAAGLVLVASPGAAATDRMAVVGGAALAEGALLVAIAAALRRWWQATAVPRPALVLAVVPVARERARR
jgi:uncharacterized membrane protein HdeD (DUF308 family)